MKKSSLGIALLALASAGSAMAADLPIYTKAPPPVVLDPWTGFYVGGNVGYSWGRWDSTSPFALTFPTGAGIGATTPAGFANAIATDFTNSASPNVKGWIGGGQAGYNWLRGQWLFGLEGDLQASGERASLDGGAALSFTFGDGTRVTDTITMSNSWNLRWFGTFRGRVGMTVGGDNSWLLYATGGLAVGRQEFSHSQLTTVTLTTPAGATASASAALAGSEATTRAGIAVGAGIEKAIDKNWRLKVEYLYLDFGTHTFLAGIGPGITTVAGPATIDTSIRMRDNIVRVGLNYRFPPM